VAIVVALMDMLPTPSIDGVGKVYQQLKNILGTTTALQAESSLQHQVDASISTLNHSKDGGQRAAQEAPEAGTTSSLTWISAHNQLGRLGSRSELQVHHQHHLKDNDAQFQCCVWNPCRRCHNDCEGCIINLEEQGSKDFKGTMRDVRFPKHFQAPSNVVKYDGKTNPNVWLEDYRLTCKVGGEDDDLFIIQFLPIYLAARVWLDHLLRNVIDGWEDLR
jgi:hypothetical protein